MTIPRCDLRRRLLQEYATAPPQIGHDRLFRRLLVGHLAAAAVLGTFLWTADVPAAARVVAVTARSVTVRLGPEFLASVQPRPRPAEPEEIRPETRLAQTETTDQRFDPVPPEPSPAEVPTASAPARRVYGVRRVFARGLGAGSDGDGALVVKRGNSLDGVADTLTATEADLRASAASVAPLSTVEQAPVPIHQVRPRYSAALIEHRVSGVVRARLLVRSDGSVGRVEIVEDVGYDSRELATEALRQFRFRPAMRDGRPVAVIITFQIRFEFQE